MKVRGSFPSLIAYVFQNRDGPYYYRVQEEEKKRQHFGLMCSVTVCGLLLVVCSRLFAVCSRLLVICGRLLMVCDRCLWFVSFVLVCARLWLFVVVVCFSAEIM